MQAYNRCTVQLRARLRPINRLIRSEKLHSNVWKVKAQITPQIGCRCYRVRVLYGSVLLRPADEIIRVVKKILTRTVYIIIIIIIGTLIIIAVRLSFRRYITSHIPSSADEFPRRHRVRIVIRY